MLQDSLIGKDGLPLANGTIICYHDNSRTVLKDWYYQTGSPGSGEFGNYNWITLPNPLRLSASGTIVDINGNDTIPFFYPYFQDENGVNIFDPYFIRVLDKNGELQFVRAYFPFVANQNVTPSGPAVNTQENLIANNRFWRNCGAVNATTLPLDPNEGIEYIQSGNFGNSYNTTSNPNYYYVTIAPSQSDGFSMPDINFIKTANGGTDLITFESFSNTITTSLDGDIIPEYYINHESGSDSSGTQFKIYQFPISLHLATLSGCPFSVTIQAQSVLGNSFMTFQLYQFRGTGVESPEPTVLDTVILSNEWAKYTINSSTVFPDDNGISVSSSGDDAYYLQISLPLTAIEVNFTLPSIFLSQTQQPTNSFQTYDQVDTIISKPRTGDIRTSLNKFYFYGWVPMSNGTIGWNPNDVPALPTARNNQDTWPLFNLIWSLFSPYSNGSVNPLAQMYETGTTATPIGYGSSAYADWIANRQLALTNSMGQVLMGSAPVTSLLLSYKTEFTASNGAPALLITAINAMNAFRGMPFYVSNEGGALPGNLSANTIYYITADAAFSSNTFHVSSSFAAAMAGTAIAFTTAGTGTQTITLTLSGMSTGEYAHAQLANEVGAHSHPALLPAASFLMNTGAGQGVNQIQQIAPGNNTLQFGATTGPNVGGIPFNVTQPSTFNNIYIKL